MMILFFSILSILVCGQGAVGANDAPLNIPKPLPAPAEAPLPNPWDRTGVEVFSLDDMGTVLAKKIGELLELEPSDPKGIVEDLLSGELKFGAETMESWPSEQRCDLVREARRLSQGTIINGRVFRQLSRLFKCSYGQIRMQVAYLENSGLWNDYCKLVDQQILLEEMNREGKRPH